ncbi:hypothetical protein [Streptomyces sp. NPDC029003]|uniref:hypothetical protein n=1 Tax=Streptomyces sp. NPDC029003 TaxID=3155125 RepID=UPI0033D1771C
MQPILSRAISLLRWLENSQVRLSARTGVADGGGAGAAVLADGVEGLAGLFPDLVAAAVEQLPVGLALDGELLVWDAEAVRGVSSARSRATAGCVHENEFWHTFREDDQWPWDSSPSAGHAVQSAQPSVFEHDSWE